MVGEREHVGDDLVSGVILDALGLGRARIAALIGRDDEMVGGERGDLVPPGAMRFGETVEQDDRRRGGIAGGRSEEHTSELQSLMRISYAVFCLKKKKKNTNEK